MFQLSKRLAVALVATVLSGAAGVAPAGTVVVTEPAGLTTVSDTPTAFDTWYRLNVRAGSSIGITETYPRSGNGSMEMNLSDGVGKADAEYYFSTPQALADLTHLSYDWYRNSSSTVAAHLHPSLRLIVDAGALGRGYLIYETVYNGGASGSPVTTDAWVHADATGAFLWSTGSLPGAFADYNNTIADWNALLPGAKIVGLSSGIGSGWGGSFAGAVDNISIGFGGSEPTTFNFETNAQVVPLPAAAWAGLALFGAIGVRRTIKRCGETDAI